MPDYWLDADSFITAKRGPYGFDIAPGFWTFLGQKASEGVISSSVLVYNEILNGEEDDLVEWVRQRKEVLFVDPDPTVQARFREIADYVNSRYPAHQASHFLDGADPWIIAHARAYGGRVVTFEVRAPKSTKPKIPDVANRFNVRCLNLYSLLRELGASFGPMQSIT